MKARLPKEYQSKSQSELLKQAQQMQVDMENKQQELEEKEYSANAGGDMVQATINGKHLIKSLKISQELLEEAKDDIEMLEDLIITAVNTAVNEAISESDEAMSSMTSGLNIPGLF